ncbi:hypothetical protein BN903_84 [Halorubrum sp. AJ67]|nr:hypothetical protein BN903_84 [Halorubrum sp. AJ67]
MRLSIIGSGDVRATVAACVTDRKHIGNVDVNADKVTD